MLATLRDNNHPLLASDSPLLDGLFGSLRASYGGWTQDGEDLVAEVEVPGFSREDLEVSMTNGVITVRGEVGKRKTSYVTLVPKTCDPETLEAKLDNGLLTFRVGKKQEAKTRRLEIK